VAAGEKPAWAKLTRGFSDPVPGSEIRPQKAAVKVYEKMLVKFALCERAALDSL